MAIATATLITAAIQVVASIALNFVAKALRKKPKTDTDSLDFEQSVQRRLRNGQPLEVLVGRRIAAGVGIFDDAYGNKNEYGVSVTVLSAKPCTAFHTLFVDGEPVTLSGNPASGEVEVTSHFLGKNNARRIKVRLFLGDNNVSLGEYLAAKFPGKFSSLDDGGEYCVLVTECRNTNDDFDEESGENFIPFQGYPEFKVELSGVRVCDPRSGGNYGDESSYVFSNNAALIDAQYDYGWYDGTGDGRSLIVGNGYPEGLMDIVRISSNADYCDAENFTCAGIVRSGSSDQEEIWKCYNADRVEHPASIYSVPEGDRILSETLDLSAFPAAHISEYDEDGYSTEVYNEIQTVYAEPEEFYGEKDLPIYSRPEWIAADNHIPRQLSLPLLFVSDKMQAAKLEKQEICISRTPATCQIADLPFGFIRIGVGDVITLTGSAVSAVNNREWVVKGKGQSPMGDVSLSLSAFAGDAAFSFDESIEAPVIDIIIPIPRPWPWWENTPYINPSTFDTINIDVNGIIAGTRQVADINIANRGALIAELDGIDVSMTGLNTDVTGIKDGTLSLSDVTLAGRGTLIGELDTHTTDINGLDLAVNDTVSGVAATHTEVQAIVSGTRLLGDVNLTDTGSIKLLLESQSTNLNTAITQSAGTMLTITSNKSSISATADSGASATTGTITATASGGTSPYSYVWTLISGGAGVSIDSANSAGTTFSGTPGTNLLLTGEYRCTVTDGANDTQSVDVTVTLIDITDFGGTGGGLIA